MCLMNLLQCDEFVAVCCNVFQRAVVNVPGLYMCTCAFVCIFLSRALFLSFSPSLSPSLSLALSLSLSLSLSRSLLFLL